MLVSTNVLVSTNATYLWTCARQSIRQRQGLALQPLEGVWPKLTGRFTLDQLLVSRLVCIGDVPHGKTAFPCHFFLSLCVDVWAPQATPFSFKHQCRHRIGGGDTDGRLLWNVSRCPPCLPSAAAPRSVGPPHLHCGSSALRNLWAPKGDPGSVISTQGSYLDVFFLPFPKPWSKYDMKIITVPAFWCLKCSQHSKTGEAFPNTRNNIRPPPQPVIFYPVAPFIPWALITNFNGLICLSSDSSTPTRVQGLWR